jgi:hypothetical protein
MTWSFGSTFPGDFFSELRFALIGSLSIYCSIVLTQQHFLFESVMPRERAPPDRSTAPGTDQIRGIPHLELGALRLSGFFPNIEAKYSKEYNVDAGGIAGADWPCFG